MYTAVNYLILKDGFVQDQDKPVDLLELSSQIHYGNKVSGVEQKSIVFKLDDFGEAALLFNTGVFNADKFPGLEISIANLPINYRAYLVWSLFSDLTVYEMQLMQSDGNIQTNLLNSNPEWTGRVVQFGVKIAPQNQLGLIIPSDAEIIIETLVLRNFNFFDDYSMLLNQWLSYEPWTYQSINHLKVNKLLPKYAHPFVFILMWLIISYALVLIIERKKKYFISLAIAAWMFLDLIQLNNIRKISIWTDAVYAGETKRHVDDQLYEISQQMKAFLGYDSENSSEIKHNKVLVLSSDKYQRARVIYHMLPVNSSFLDINIDSNQAAVTPGDYIFSLSLVRDPMRPDANNQLKFNNLTIDVKEMVHGDFISIMEVLK